MNRSHTKWIGIMAVVLLTGTIFAWNLVATPRPATPTVSGWRLGGRTKTKDKQGRTR